MSSHSTDPFSTLFGDRRGRPESDAQTTAAPEHPNASKSVTREHPLCRAYAVGKVLCRIRRLLARTGHIPLHYRGAILSYILVQLPQALAHLHHL